MNKTLRNFWLDMLLFLLLGLDLALVGLTPRELAGVHPGPGWHVHALVSILLSLGCLLHIALHWPWLKAVLSGKAGGRGKLIMNGMVMIMMLLANLSGHTILESNAANGLHSLTGYLALIGMFVHGLRHAHWMAMMAKRLIVGGGQKNAIRSV